jgi:hypothetical protein
MHIDLRLQVAINLISSANKVQRGDRGMMAYLFRVYWASIDEALKSFTQNRIERFLNIEIQYTICESESDAPLESI